MPIFDSFSREEIEFFPENFSLWVKLDIGLYENDCKIERIIDDHSFEIIHLYKPGYVLLRPTERLKLRSKVQWIDFIFLGKGFYLNFYHQMVPFYRDSWIMKNFSKKEGEALYRKSFAVTQQSLVLESKVQINGPHHRENQSTLTIPTEDIFLNGEVLEYMEQVFFSISHEDYDQVDHTVLALERASDYDRKGFTAPQSFIWGNQKHVFINPPSSEEQESVDAAILRSAIKVSRIHEGQEAQYASFFYDGLCLERDKVHIYFERVNSS